MNNRNKSFFRTVLSLGLAFLMITFTVSAQAGNATPKIQGKTIGNWGHAWWQWVLDLPTQGNPLLTDGNIDCSAGQSGKVWFLAGMFGDGNPPPVERTCTIKKGKAIFFPIINAVKWTPLDPAVPEDCINEQNCREVAQFGSDAVTRWTCTVDGVPCVWFNQIVRAQSDVLPFVVKAGSVLEDFGYTPGIREISISDGYWVMLDPLPPGEHTIRFTSFFPNPQPPAPDFSVDVTYHLTVSAL